MRRAQQVLLEIARQSTGDAIVGKTKLFKTFYLAHLFYAAKSPGYLTEWRTLSRICTRYSCNTRTSSSLKIGLVLTTVCSNVSLPTLDE